MTRTEVQMTIWGIVATLLAAIAWSFGWRLTAALPFVWWVWLMRRRGYFGESHRSEGE